MADNENKPPLGGFMTAGLIGLVKFFNGEPGTTNVHEFFDSLETASLLAGEWDDRTKIAVLRTRLTGAALQFFNANRTVNDGTWDEIMRNFKLWFKDSTPSHIDPLYNFYRTAQRLDETAKSFVIRLKLAGKIAANAPQDEATRVARKLVIEDSLLQVFLQNLRDESGKDLLQNFPPEDLDTAVTRATQYEINRTNKKRIYSIDVAQSPALDNIQINAPRKPKSSKSNETENQSSNFSPKAETKLIAVITDLDKTVQGLKQLQKDQSPSPRNDQQKRDYQQLRDAQYRHDFPELKYNQNPNRNFRTHGPPISRNRSEKICYRCGVANHIATFCSAPANATRLQLKCEHCLRVGHSTKECGQRNMRVNTNDRNTRNFARPNQNFSSRST